MADDAEITLTPLREDDSDVLFEWINDRDLVLLNAPFKPVSRGDHDRWFELVRDRSDVAIYAIRKAGDKLIGTCQLNEIDPDASSARLQIRIGERSEWGQGLGTEAVRLLLGRARDELGLRTVRLDVFAENDRAIRAYEKAGFSRTGRVSPATIAGEPKDVVEMEASVGG